MKRLLGITTVITAVLCLCWSQAAGQNGNKAHKPNVLDCKQCHTCDRPTAHEQCLKPCPSLSSAHTPGTSHALAEAPESITLGTMADLYQPVKFDHKIHAGMAEMGSNCKTCHHYSPEGKIPPCKECHQPGGSEANLRQPGLKGAYHRQCMGCHREWSHDTKCVMCHLPAEGKALASSASDATDIMGTTHPVITEPKTRVYKTPYTKGPTVTFHHSEHIHLFGLKCVNCHKQENCQFCHDLNKPAAIAKSQEEVHAICNDCHRKDACEKCHGLSEKPAFVHAVTGWPLNRFHTSLDCRACHPTGKRIAKLNSQCVGCHSGWKPGGFRHGVTGLVLDAAHAELECESCHLERKFDQKPDCSTCHDDNREYKKQPPGQYSGLD